MPIERSILIKRIKKRIDNIDEDELNVVFALLHSDKFSSLVNTLFKKPICESCLSNVPYDKRECGNSDEVKLDIMWELHHEGFDFDECSEDEK